MIVEEFWKRGREARVASLAHLDRVAADSVALDSRVDALCARTGQDPVIARQWLAEGHAIDFVTECGALVHRICPGELV